MRRFLLAAVLAGLVTGLTAGPAMASAPVHSRSSYASIEAFWHSKVRLSATRFKLITWYVGVYPSSNGTFSDLYKEVDKCHMVSGHRRCAVESYSSGFRKSLTANQFTYDSKRLATAHIDAAYKLRTFTKEGVSGHAFRVTIVANWTGTGKLSRDGGTSTYHSGCLGFHYTFKDRNRSATATGAINGKSLGSTNDAFLSVGTSLSVQHDCRS
ncbi:MAG TPA: hypothetical protein VIV12_14950 [Streptosporangiaceae bacterium]